MIPIVFLMSCIMLIAACRVESQPLIAETTENAANTAASRVIKTAPLVKNNNALLPNGTIVTPAKYQGAPVQQGYDQIFQKVAGKASWTFALTAKSDVRETAENTWIFPGDAIFLLNEKDLFIAPTGDRKHTNLYDKASIPGSGKKEGKGEDEDEDGGNLDTFSVSGYTAVLKSLDGAGYVVLLEEFGQRAPVLRKHDKGFMISDAEKLRVVFFEDGGYNRIAQIIREWMKEKDYYRHLFDKPYGKQLEGAAALRPVQHGAIGKAVWDQITEIIPKAVMVWRTSDPTPGGASDGLDKFTVELQKELDKKGEYYFLPWAGMALAVSEEEAVDGYKWFSFDKMPQAQLNQWTCLVKGTPYQPDKGRGYLYCPLGLKERMEYWLYNKMPKHPHTYRTDGANIDTLPYWFKPDRFVACEHHRHPAGFSDLVQGYEEMVKTVYDKGGIITHEGIAFFLEKYMFGGYGRPLVSIGSNSGFYLKAPGRNTEPSIVLNAITNSVPINQLVYHDQIAMRLHDAESLNMRYKNDTQTETIRRYKFLYNALFGLTPNVQLGGEKADEWVTADLVWLRKEMPRAIETYTKTYGQAILEHKFLTDDHLVQQCTYENGVSVIANFDSKDRNIGDIVIEAMSYIVNQLEASEQRQ